MSSKTLEGMARASVDADGCDGDYDKNPPEIRDALATDMKRALLWLADNVSDEMLEAFNKAKGITRRVAWEDGQAILAISAALRAAAGEAAQ